MRKILLMPLFLFIIITMSFGAENPAVDKSLDVAEKTGETYINDETGQAGPAIAYDFELGLEYTYAQYKESSISVKDTTDFYGLNGSVTGRSKETAIMGRIEARFAGGPVHYDGQLNDGSPFTDNGNDYVFEARGLVGRDFTLGNSTITPMVGFGYRYLNDKLDSNYAYERDIRYLYSPIGVEAAVPLADTWKMVAKAEYDAFWSGVVKSHLSDVDTNYSNLRNKQDGGYGLRASVAFQKKIKNSMYLSLEPYFRYWDIDQSDNTNVTYAGKIIGYGYEPANRTKEYGIKVSIIW